MPHREKFHVETWSIVAIVQPNCVYQLIKSVPLLLLCSMHAFIKMSIMADLLSPHTSQETLGTRCRFLLTRPATFSYLHMFPLWFAQSNA